MELQYTTTYTQRKKLTITVERDRSIVVMAPLGTSPEKIHEVVESRKIWIYEKLQHPQKYDPAPRKEFVSGETVLYLGRNYRLEIQKGTEESIRFQGKFIVTGISSDRAAKLFKEWYIGKARKKIIPRVQLHASNLGVQVNKVMVSERNTRKLQANDGSEPENIHIQGPCRNKRQRKESYQADQAQLQGT